MSQSKYRTLPYIVTIDFSIQILMQDNKVSLWLILVTESVKYDYTGNLDQAERMTLEIIMNIDPTAGAILYI